MSVFANGRSILHQGSSAPHIAAAPDVCKTPTPGGPVPIPYPNIARASDLAKGAKKTRIKNKPVALKSANVSTSTGDEAGTAGGGLVSSKTKGKMTWSTASADVRVEGQGVARFLDATLHNGNTSNTVGVAPGETGLYYGDDERCKRLRQGQEGGEPCGRSLQSHRVPETEVIRDRVGDLFTALSEILESQRPVIEEGIAALEARRVEKAQDDQRLADANAPWEGRSKKGRKFDPVRISAIDTANDNGTRHRERVTALRNQLADTHLLNLKNKLYYQGYMVGAAGCQCGEHALVVAKSNRMTPGFESAVGNLSAPGAQLVDFPDGIPLSDAQKQTIAAIESNEAAWTDTKWTCAGPKVATSIVGPHKVGSMSERFYKPFGGGVTVTYAEAQNGQFEMRDGQFVKNTTRTFDHGKSVPSCAKCQALLPDYFCDKGPCEQ